MTSFFLIFVNCLFINSVLQVSGLYEYKIMGSISDVLPEVCKQVYMDLEYRRKWDDYVNGKLCLFHSRRSRCGNAVVFRGLILLPPGEEIIFPSPLETTAWEAIILGLLQ